mmetsp:Transcript_20068/g.32652  ORF Transcript_20068/g.32652 Transcript_20068/m.32652 type:complete len:803 (+) Transcript_20068:291-2699(+)
MSSAMMELEKQKKKKRKKKTKKKVALLSFGGDEEEDEGTDTFKIKKSNTSSITFEKGKRKKKKRSRKIAGPGGNESAKAGSLGNKAYLQSSGRYTAEALKALKGNAIHFAPTTESKKSADTISQEPIGMELGGQNEEHLNVEGMRQHGDQEDCDAGQHPCLPDKHAIIAARRKREMMRTMGVGRSSAPGYIPLDTDRRTASGTATLAEGKIYGEEEDNEHGGLVTENPDDEEQDVFEEDNQKGNRILMHDPGRKGGIDEQSRQQILGRGQAEDDDDEYQRHIDEQIRRGGGRVAKASKYVNALTDSKGTGVKKYAPSQQRITYDPDRELQRLASALSTTKENYLKGARDLNALNIEIKNGESDISGYESKLKSMNKQYIFYQSLREKVCDCLDCLNTKAPIIDEALQEMKELQLSKAKAVRRLYDLHTMDEEDTVFGNKDKKRMQKQEVDEFGRDIGGALEQGRASRQQVRNDKRKNLFNNDKYREKEGFWTDDEEELGSQYDQRQNQLLQDVKRIFSDAEEDHKSLHAIKNSLELLKKRYPQAYADTYISLSVPSLFAPYVKVQLVHWNFLKNPKLEAMEWYKTVAEYGLFGDIKDDDHDLDVIPKIVEKVVTPFLIDYFFTVWDPLSSTLFPATSSLVREVLEHVDGKLENPQKLLSTIMDRFHNVVNAHSKSKTVPEGNTPKSHPQWRFCELRWWKGLKIIKMLTLWRQHLLDGVIRELSMSHMADNLVPFLLKEMRTKPIDTKKVILLTTKLNKVLPEDWKGDIQYMTLYKGIKDYWKLCRENGVSAKDLALIKALVK